MRTVLENPTRYHVIQKQKNQVRQYLSESFHQGAAWSDHMMQHQQPEQCQPHTTDVQHSQSDTQIFQMPSNESLNTSKDNQLLNFVRVAKFNLNLSCSYGT